MLYLTMPSDLQIDMNIVFPDDLYTFAENSDRVMTVGGANWNGNVIFPNGLDHPMIYGDDRFSGYVTIPNSVTNCDDMFNLCKIFNKPVTIPENVTSCVGMFNYCFFYNQPTVIPNNVTRCTGMFRNCQGFNQVGIDIPENVTGCASMFDGCTSFNGSVNIPDNAKIESYQRMFNNCRKFNQPVVLSNTATVCYGMFSNCLNFNQPLYIPPSVTDCSDMFYNCRKLNQPIRIDTALEHDPTVLGGSFTRMFYNCVTFNQPMTVPFYADMTNMFAFCSNLNSPVSLFSANANGMPTFNVAYMFQGCSNFNQNISFPNTHASLNYTFFNSGMRANIYINRCMDYYGFGVLGMLNGTFNYPNVTIYSNNVLPFYYATGANNSVVANTMYWRYLNQEAYIEDTYHIILSRAYSG